MAIGGTLLAGTLVGSLQDCHRVRGVLRWRGCRSLSACPF